MPDDLRPNFLVCPAAPELPAPEAALHAPVLLEKPPAHEILPPPIPALQLPAPKHTLGRKIIIAICVLITGFAILFFGVVVYGAVSLGGAVSDLRTSAQLMRSDIERRDFVAAETQLIPLGEALNRLADGVGRLEALRDFPLVGKDVRTLEQVMEIAQTLSGGVEQTVRAAAAFETALQSVGLVERGLDGSIISGRSFGDLSPSEKEEILSRFAVLLPELRAAREQLKLATSLWTDLSIEARQSSMIAPLASYGARLPEITARADQMISFLDLLLPLVGHPTENRYLVVLQNSDELRPTGGFLGTVGYLRVKSADIKDMRFDDVYSLDNPVSGVWKVEPPAPMKRYLAISSWFFRDRNWSPDVPTSAENMMETYLAERALVTTSTNDRLDGVIFFTPELFEDVLRFVGPVTVDGKTFTADTFFDQLQYDTEIGFLSQGISVERRKDLVIHLGDALLKKLMQQSTDRLPDLLDLLTNNLAKKNAMFYLRDARTQNLLDNRGWTGRVAGTPGDYLWIVDANLAALKTDGKMEKDARYSVDLTTGIATVSLRYHNTTRQIDWRYTRYRDYVRIYVPEGSELISSSGAMEDDRSSPAGEGNQGVVDVTKELGKTVFGAFWSIEPGQTKELRFTYRLPARLIDTLRASGEYSLLVQRQPGSNLRLTLDSALGKNIRSATPPEASSEFGDQRYRLSVPLDRDRSFRVRF